MFSFFQIIYQNKPSKPKLRSHVMRIQIGGEASAWESYNHLRRRIYVGGSMLKNENDPDYIYVYIDLERVESLHS